MYVTCVFMPLVRNLVTAFSFCFLVKRDSETDVTFYFNSYCVYNYLYNYSDMCQ